MLPVKKKKKDFKPAAHVAHMFVSKKAQDREKKEEEDFYAHMDKYSMKVHKKSFTIGVKTALDMDVNMEAVQRGSTSFGVKGLNFHYYGLTVLVDNNFADFYCSTMGELTQKVFARALIMRNNPDDRGRSHSRVLPVMICNLTADQPVPTSAKLVVLPPLDANNSRIKDAFDLPPQGKHGASPEGIAVSVPQLGSTSDEGGAGDDEDANGIIGPPSMPITTHPSAALYVSQGVQHGNLHDTITKGRRITQRNVVKWVFQILNTVHYWHLRFVTVGDIVASDIALVSDKSILKSLTYVIPELERKSRSGTGSRNRSRQTNSASTDDSRDSEYTNATDYSLTSEERAEQEEQKRLESIEGQRQLIEEQRTFQAERDAWLNPRFWLERYDYKQGARALDDMQKQHGGRRPILDKLGDPLLSSSSSSSSSQPLRPDQHPSATTDATGKTEIAKAGAGAHPSPQASQTSPIRAAQVSSKDHTPGGHHAKRRIGESHEDPLRKFENVMAGLDTGQCVFKSRERESKATEALVEAYTNFHTCVRRDLRHVGNIIFGVLLKREPNVTEARAMLADNCESFSIEDAKAFVELTKYPKSLQDALAVCLSKESDVYEPLRRSALEGTFTELVCLPLERMKKVIKPLAAQVEAWTTDNNLSSVTYQWTPDDEFARLRAIWAHKEKMNKAAIEGQIRAEKRVRFQRYKAWLDLQTQEFRDQMAARKERRRLAIEQAKERYYFLHYGAWHAWDKAEQLSWMKSAVRACVMRGFELEKERKHQRLDAYKTENMVIVQNALHPVEQKMWEMCGREVIIPTRAEIIESRKPTADGMKRIKLPTKEEIEKDRRRMLRYFADFLAREFQQIAKRNTNYVLYERLTWAAKEALRQIQQSPLLQVLKKQQYEIKRQQLTAKIMATNYKFLQESTITAAKLLKIRDRTWCIKANFMVALAVVEKFDEESAIRFKGDVIAAQRMQAVYQSDKTRRLIRKVMILAEVEIKEAVKRKKKEEELRREEEMKKLKEAGIDDSFIEEVNLRQEMESMQGSSMFDDTSSHGGLTTLSGMNTLDDMTTDTGDHDGRDEDEGEEEEDEVARTRRMLEQQGGPSERRQLELLAMEMRAEEEAEQKKREEEQRMEDLKSRVEIYHDPTEASHSPDGLVALMVKVKLGDYGTFLHRTGKLDIRVSRARIPKDPTILDAVTASKRLTLTPNLRRRLSRKHGSSKEERESGDLNDDDNDDDDNDDDDDDEGEIGLPMAPGATTTDGLPLAAATRKGIRTSGMAVLSENGGGEIDDFEWDPDSEPLEHASEQSVDRVATSAMEGTEQNVRAASSAPASREGTPATARKFEREGILVITLSGDHESDPAEQEGVEIEYMRPPKGLQKVDSYYIGQKQLEFERAFELLPKNAATYGRPPPLSEKMALMGWHRDGGENDDPSKSSPFFGFAEASTHHIVGMDPRPSSPVSRPSTADPADFENPEDCNWDEASFGVMDTETPAHETGNDPQRYKWEGYGGRAPKHVEKWRYFRVRIRGILGATSYRVLSRAQQSLLEMSPIEEFGMSFHKIMSFNTEESQEMLNALMDSPMLECAPASAYAAACYPQPCTLMTCETSHISAAPAPGNKAPVDEAQVMGSGPPVDPHEPLLGRSGASTKSDASTLKTEDLEGEIAFDASLLTKTRVLSRVQWRPGYAWGAILEDIEVARRVVPVAQPEYRRLYEVQVAKMREAELEANKATRAYPQLVDAKTATAAAAPSAEDDDDASALSMGSAEEFGVSQLDVDAYVDTIPFEVVKVFDTANDPGARPPATAKPGTRKVRRVYNFSETIVVEEVVNRLVAYRESQDASAFEKALFAHVTESGEGLGVQYRIRVRNAVGWSDAIFTQIMTFDDRLDRILRLDPKFIDEEGLPPLTEMTEGGDLASDEDSLTLSASETSYVPGGGHMGRTTLLGPAGEPMKVLKPSDIAEAYEREVLEHRMAQPDGKADLSVTMLTMLQTNVQEMFSLPPAVKAFEARAGSRPNTSASIREKSERSEWKKEEEEEVEGREEGQEEDNDGVGGAPPHEYSQRRESEEDEEEDEKGNGEKAKELNTSSVTAPLGGVVRQRAAGVHANGGPELNAEGAWRLKEVRALAIAARAEEKALAMDDCEGENISAAMGDGATVNSVEEEAAYEKWLKRVTRSTPLRRDDMLKEGIVESDSEDEDELAWGPIRNT